MKMIFLLPCLLLANPLFAAKSPEEDLLQRSLEAECKESWCQGAYAVSFRRVIGNAKKGELLVQLTLRNSARVKVAHGNEVFDAQLDQDNFAATCRLKGLTGEFLEADSKRPSPAVREGLGQCLDSLSSRIDLIMD